MLAGAVSPTSSAFLRPLGCDASRQLPELQKFRFTVMMHLPQGPEFAWIRRPSSSDLGNRQQSSNYK